MNKIGLALLFILFGIFLILKKSNLIPDNFGVMYIRLAEQYWPVLIVLFGLKLLIKDKYWAISSALTWLIVFLIGLWLIFNITGHNNWVT